MQLFQVYRRNYLLIMIFQNIHKILHKRRDVVEQTRKNYRQMCGY